MKTSAEIPVKYTPILFTTEAHLDRFFKLLPRWQQLRPAGVRFAEDIPHAIVHTGMASRQKLPLPFLGSSTITLTATKLTLHAEPVPLQRSVRSSAFNLIERSKTTRYENLLEDFSVSLPFKSIQDIHWHTSKSHEPVGSVPPGQDYIMVQYGDDGESLLLQATAAFDKEKVVLKAAQYDQREIQQVEDALAQTQSLYEDLLSYWQNERSEKSGLDYSV